MLVLAAFSLIAQTTASIQGNAIDAKTSKPVPAAWIFANRTTAPPVSKRVKSDGDGSFQIQGLTAGTYSICVQAGEQYLDPCQWGAVPTNVTISAGQGMAGVSVRLAAASALTIQVADPAKVLDQLTTDRRHADLNLGVWGPHGVYYPAHRASVSPTLPAAATADPGTAPSLALLSPTPAVATYTYRLAVPFDTALNFSITSHDLKLADAGGVALPANASLQAFRHTTGDAKPKTFAFSVLGLK
jgi:hypothetical protein